MLQLEIGGRDGNLGNGGGGVRYNNLTIGKEMGVVGGWKLCNWKCGVGIAILQLEMWGRGQQW